MAKVARKWIRGKNDELAVREGCWFDESAAARVEKFFTTFLRHSKGADAGKPFELLDWQRDEVIYPLFGWKRADGRRRFTRAYIEIPKKNGKSTLAAGLVLYMLVADNEPGAEVYGAANDRDQAGIVFAEAANMVEKSPALSSRLNVVRSTKRITCGETQSFYKALSADVPTKEGLNIHGLIVDELHAHKTRAMWDTLTYGGAARRQPLSIVITTAGFDRESICWEQHGYAERVIAGDIADTAFLGLIYAAAETDDWKDPMTWAKANPSLGGTLNVSEMQERCMEAQLSPAKQNAFKRYRLNIWTEQDVRWLDRDAWDACGGPVDLEELEGRRCFLGLDLASTTDLACVSWVFPPTYDDEPWRVYPKFYCPETAPARREKAGRVKIGEWVRSKHITATPGDVIDYSRIKKDIVDWRDRFRIMKIAIDRWNATQLSTLLQEDGFEVVGFGQGFASMAAPSKRLEELVISGALAHGGHPVLSWNAGNVSVIEDAAGNLKPTKEKSTEKIDGIVATIMAIGIADAAPTNRSKYDVAELMVL